MFAQSCPYKLKDDDFKFFFCTGNRDLPNETQYYYTLFFEPAKILYILLVFENLINLAYYKDVVFGLMLVIEFLGFWNNNESLQK